MPQDFYQEDEAEAILRLAARRGVTGGMSRDALLRVAGEVGISPDAVEEAERQLAGQRADVELAAEFRRKQRVDYSERLASFIGTGALLTGIWYFIGHSLFFWPGIVMVVMAGSLVKDFPEHFFSNGSSYQQAFAKWKVKRDRKALKAAQEAEGS
jgi:hypothetical protein